MLKKLVLVISKKPIDEQLRELKNYEVNDLITKAIILAYMDDNLSRFFKVYKTTKEMFDVIKVSYDVNIATHMQVLLKNTL